jgi:putative heme-binding domain-containing protein
MPSLRFVFLLGTLALSGAAPRAVDAAGLELRPGDHVCIIGNTLAERMQHHGWLETLIHSRFPRHELVVRNLGYSGDELTLRLRSAGFGSPDDHLSFNKADVILAFFGFNESFGGPEGLEKFKADLDKLIRDTIEKKYNGHSAPRLVLFSPVAHEDLGDPNLPDGSENNRNIALYTKAMAEVATTRGVLFVDLFRISEETYRSSDAPLTINGVHLNDYGDRRLAPRIEAALFPGEPAPDRDPAVIHELRAAVLEKNFYWFHRHRIVDGYSVYGGRAGLSFVDGQTNKVVMDREFEVLDVMTSNRDKRIWAVAQGRDLAADDSNTPPFLTVKTNKTGSGPGGTHLFLDGEGAITRMKVHPGMKVNLFASEKEFPELQKPVQMAFDARGRLWVAVMPSYPHWRPKDEMDDKVLILEDTDGDGRADRSKVFADRLHVPTGLEFWGGGLFVGQQPVLMFLKDTDGDDRADYRERVLHGVDSADTHHALNSFVLDPGGALYFQEGTFHHTQVETLWGPQRCANAGVFRYEPRTHRFEVYVSYPFANPHGHVFDRWGQDFVTDGTGNVNYFAAAFSGRVDFPQKHSELRPFFPQRTRPCPGTEILSSRHFPDELQGNYLDANVIGFQGILQYRIEDQGSGFTAKEVDPIVESSDPNFRPADMEIGPDGALYFLDWQNPIIGHMQHNLRDPSRDQIHGRVYRVTYPSRPLLKPARIAGEPVAKLLDLLKEPEDRVRYRVRIELSARPSTEVLAAAKAWVAGLDPTDKDHEHYVLEALWLHQSHNTVDEALLRRVLRSPEFRARAAATRVLCYWRDRVPYSLELLKQLAADPHPRVRLEAVRAASFFDAPEAVEVALISAEQPSDYYLDYVRQETMKTLEPRWKKVLAQKRRIHVSSPAGARFFLGRLSVEELLGLDRDRMVCIEILRRSGLLEEQRRGALQDLARIDAKGETEVLLDLIRRLDEGGPDAGALQELARLLVARTPAELAARRAELETFATTARQPVTRQIGFVALVAADGGGDRAWELASASRGALRDLVEAVPLITDATVRASFYDRTEPLLRGLPEGLAGGAVDGSGTRGRYVRVELLGRRTLTLAEIEVLSDGRNVAHEGKASQKNTAHGGEAQRAIDGNRDGSYSAGGQTHTEESTRDPWWELDLGSERPIDAVTVYNRVDGDLGKRLDKFTLRILDGSRQPVFERENNPAPKRRADFVAAAGGVGGQVRRAAMAALTSVRGKEAAAFRALAPFVRSGTERAAAVAALQRIPRSYWPQEEARPLVESLVAIVRGVPAQDRTMAEVLDALQFADALAALLPADEARRVRGELGELGVRVVRLSTRPHEMLYDKDSFAVAAGKAVEVVFENSDIMPHNFVVTRPGALEAVGGKAEATATESGALERHYVPQSPEVLVSSRLLGHKEAERLSFTAPTELGVYPYVCTYPGHWRRMFGAMYVVADLDAYLADAEAYLAAHPMEAVDDLLKLRRPRKQWTVEELAPALGEAFGGRSYGNGKQLFQVASCTGCHRLDGAGAEFGPDLAKLDVKLTRLDILREILQPSAKLNEKFQAYTVVTKDGKVRTGLIVGDSPEALRMVENPLVSAEPVEILRADVVSQEKAPASTMPLGLLDQLTYDEVLDLVAYVESRGDRSHKVFQGGCGHTLKR